MKHSWWFFISILIGIFLRLYGNHWGAGFFFHPDENNIATAVSQLSFSNLNPHFFAYGSFPLYVIYSVGLISNMFSSFSDHVSFDRAVYISRGLSAMLSCALLILIYLIAKKYVAKQAAEFAVFLSVFSVGLIQFSHFGTFELWLSFFSLCFFWTCLLLFQKPTLLHFILSGIFFGALIATKVSALVLGIVFPIFMYYWLQKHRKLSLPLLYSAIALGISLFVFIATNPYVVFDFPAFINSMHYESAVALGTLPVFYTQGFINTIPGVYQLFYVFPFLLNPFVEGAVLCMLIVVGIHFVSKPTPFCGLLLVFIAVLFFSQAFLFVKWTRYMVPLLPFFYILLSFGFYTHVHKRYRDVLIRILGISVVFYTFLYAHVVLFSQDTRLAASIFMKQTIPQSTPIFAEGYDPGVSPFQPLYPNLKTEETYDIDLSTVQAEKVRALSQHSAYILLPSQRVIRTRLYGEGFPEGKNLYSEFTNQHLYTSIYTTSCDIFCTLLYMGSPVTNVEETISVFERPTVYVFKNNAL